MERTESRQGSANRRDRSTESPLCTIRSKLPRPNKLSRANRLPRFNKPPRSSKLSRPGVRQGGGVRAISAALRDMPDRQAMAPIEVFPTG